MRTTTRLIARVPAFGLLALTAALVAMVGSANGTAESEPNNDAATANAISIGGTAQGIVNWTDSDFWIISLPGPGILEMNGTVDNPPGQFLVTTPAGEWAAVAEEGPQLNPSTHRAMIRTGGPWIVTVDGRSSGHYSIRFSFSTDFSPTEGSGEVEPNNHQDNTTWVGENSTLQGIMKSSYGDADWWGLYVAGQGVLTIDFENGGGLYYMAFDAYRVLTGLLSASSNQAVVEIDAAGPVFLRLTGGGSNLTYSLRFTMAIDLSANWSGSGESEPNNNASTADTIVPGVRQHGIGDSSHDRADFFSIGVLAGQLLRVNVTFSEDPVGTSEASSVSSSAVWATVDSIRDHRQVITYVFETSVTFVMKISVGGPRVNYTIDSLVKNLTIFEDAVVTLEELNASDLGLEIRPAITPLSSAPGYSLANGDGFLFGGTLCVRLATVGDIHNISVPAGLVFRPTEGFGGAHGTLQTMVSSRNQTTFIPSSDWGCFRALSYSEEGNLGAIFDRYRIEGYLAGDAAAVMAVIDRTGKDGADGQLAMWAVTSGTSEERARQWDANESTIESARTILREAHVSTALEKLAGGAATLANALLLSFAFMGAVVVAAAAVELRRRRHAARVEVGVATIAPIDQVASPTFAASAPLAPIALAAVETPACPTCGQPSAVNANTCSHCGQPLIWE